MKPTIFIPRVAAWVLLFACALPASALRPVQPEQNTELAQMITAGLEEREIQTLEQHIRALTAKSPRKRLAAATWISRQEPELLLKRANPLLAALVSNLTYRFEPYFPRLSRRFFGSPLKRAHKVREAARDAVASLALDERFHPALISASQNLIRESIAQLGQETDETRGGLAELMADEFTDILYGMELHPESILLYLTNLKPLHPSLAAQMPTLQDLLSDPDPARREGALVILSSFIMKRVAPKDDLLKTLPLVMENLRRPEMAIRQTAQRALVAFIENGEFEEALMAKMSLLAEPEFLKSRTHEGEADMIESLASNERFHPLLTGLAPALTTCLKNKDLKVVFEAERVLTIFVEHGIHPEGLSSAVPLLMDNLHYENPAPEEQEAADLLREMEMLPPGVGVGLIARKIDEEEFPENSLVIHGAKKALETFARMGISPETLAAQTPVLAKDLEDSDHNRRYIAQELLTTFIEAGILSESMALTTIEPTITNLRDFAPVVRTAAQRTLTALAKRRWGTGRLAGATRALIENLLHESRIVRRSAAETVAAFCRLPLPSPGALYPAVKPLTRNLEEHDVLVRSSAYQALFALVEAGIITDDLSWAIEPAVKDLSQQFYFHPASGLDAQGAAWNLLTALAGHERFHAALERAAITPQKLGFSAGLGWTEAAIMASAWEVVFRSRSYSALSLGARAWLRRTLMERIRDPSALLRDQARAWVEHLARLEALDRALGFPSMGAEFHLPKKDPERLTALAGAFVKGVGPHRLNPTEEGEDQIDLRLLPAYPSTFSRLLESFLETPELDAFEILGAHYTLGIDLGENLSTLALALFYGDLTYPWLPRPRGEADVGFPGVYTYHGATLDPQTGELAEHVRQSNLYLRPLRVLELVPIGERDSILQPLNLFPQDLESLAWLSAAARAPKSSAPGRIFQGFREEWEGWLEKLQGHLLVEAARRAEKAAAESGSQGVNDVLDQTSQKIYQGLYGVSAASVAKQTSKIPAPQQLEQAAPHRRALNSLIKDTLGKVRANLFVAPDVEEFLQAYRRAKTLEELDSAYARAVETLTAQIFSGRFEHPSEEENRLIDLLSALAPERAREIRAAIEKPPRAGLEESSAFNALAVSA